MLTKKIQIPHYETEEHNDSNEEFITNNPPVSTQQVDNVKNNTGFFNFMKKLSPRKRIDKEEDSYRPNSRITDKSPNLSPPKSNQFNLSDSEYSPALDTKLENNKTTNRKANSLNTPKSFKYSNNTSNVEMQQPKRFYNRKGEKEGKNLLGMQEESPMVDDMWQD
ncbi:hypothetical protein ABK040_007899 [Willaertia magna]